MSAGTTETVEAQLAEVTAQRDALLKACKPFAHFAEMLTAKPLRGTGEQIYGIHACTEWEATILRSDLEAARAAIALCEKGAR